MTNQHPITPPRELVQQWDEEGTNMFRPAYQTHLCTQAAQWGSDQELEACCEWLKVQETQSAKWFDIRHDACALVSDLRASRRSKPPSLKEQALALIDECTDPAGDYLDDNALTTIRAALEALPND